MEIDFLITSFVALFVIIDPIGLTPLFVALTQGMSAKARRKITIRAIGVGVFRVDVICAVWGNRFGIRRHFHACLPCGRRYPLVPNGP
jgi:multiple antibiotic resistance protein